MTTGVAGLPVEALAIGGGALVAIVAGATLLRRGRRQARLDDEGAALDAAAALPGFAPGAAVVGQDGAAALVGGSDVGGHDRLALVHAQSGRLMAREIDWSIVRATRDGIVVETGKGGSVVVAGVDALDVRRLAPAASPEAVRLAERLAPPPDDSAIVVHAD